MSDPLFSVAGQVVLVAGASRGIGRAIAQGFAQREAAVIITGREQATLDQAARELGKNVQPLVCDMARKEDIEGLVERVLKEHGRIDTLINVAGVNRRMPAERLKVDDYDFIMDINLKGPFLLSLAAGRAMPSPLASSSPI